MKFIRFEKNLQVRKFNTNQTIGRLFGYKMSNSEIFTGVTGNNFS